MFVNNRGVGLTLRNDVSISLIFLQWLLYAEATLENKTQEPKSPVTLKKSALYKMKKDWVATKKPFGYLLKEK